MLQHCSHPRPKGCAATLAAPGAHPRGGEETCAGYLPARMSRSSWFVGPSCREVAMFMGLEQLHIDSQGAQSGRARSHAAPTRGGHTARILPHTERPASQPSAGHPHNTTRRLGSASSSTAHAILPPPASDRKWRAATHSSNREQATEPAAREGARAGQETDTCGWGGGRGVAPLLAAPSS